MLEWLFWQVGNLGPMAGQLSHFVNYAQGEHPYSHQRYADEYNRCLGVLERRLEGREFILGEYSIADMASWPWVLIAKPLGQPLDDFPNVARWRAAVRDRPAVQRGVDLGKEWRRSAPPSDEERADPVQPDRAEHRQQRPALISLKPLRQVAAHPRSLPMSSPHPEAARRAGSDLSPPAGRSNRPGPWPSSASCLRRRGAHPRPSVDHPLAPLAGRGPG